MIIEKYSGEVPGSITGLCLQPSIDCAYSSTMRYTCVTVHFVTGIFDHVHINTLPRCYVPPHFSVSRKEGGHNSKAQYGTIIISTCLT